MPCTEPTHAQAPTPQLDHLPALKMAGAVLLLLGVLDSVMLAYSLSHEIAYSSRCNIVAVIAGLLLLGGNLRTASIVRWLCAMALSACACWLLLWPFGQPWDLLLTTLRLAPWDVINELVFYSVATTMALWFVFKLGSPAVMAARSREGRRQRDMRIPAALGAAMMLAGHVGAYFMVHSENADKALVIAQQQKGPEYQYTITALKVGTRSTSALVTAWNDKQLMRFTIEL